ncbi:OPT oligopeptide transporter protein-domain-containing protein [Boletus reticuloceps]|uniref:OPT oligopeptide transporter protein-domain-containing protein n=1 Tax=Boletus reticuloceps TaxID=495285 RepID=A0A8I2YFU2_9AGAM|nr:OPT oligopeptide transporter protein-domain-containing protein [Boletus reticuloceps]
MGNNCSDVQPDGHPTTAPSFSDEKDEKSYYTKADVEATPNPLTDDACGIVLHSEREIAAHVISVDDDPSLNPWTFRAFSLGLGLSAFGSSLAEIYYFKPASFVTMIPKCSLTSLSLASFPGVSDVPGYHLLHSRTRDGNIHTSPWSIPLFKSLQQQTRPLRRRFLPSSAYTITLPPTYNFHLLAVFQSASRLWHRWHTETSTIYPSVLPLASMLDAFFCDGPAARRRLRVFYFVFGAVFIWELFPEWIFPLLAGLSVFCLAAPNNATVSRVFGGSNGNEGLGLLSICLDWQYISGPTSPVAIPLKSQISMLIGTILCMVVAVSVYYNNIWESQNFPFVRPGMLRTDDRTDCNLQLSQLLFYRNGTIYDQLSILNSNYEVDPTLLAEQGLPFYAGTFVVNLISINMGVAATFTHLLLWNRDDLRESWSWMSPSNLFRQWKEFTWNNVEWKFWNDNGMRKQPMGNEDIDPHYAQMLKYPETPNSWYYATFVVSFIGALVVIYKSDSTLPWWGFVIAVLLAVIFVLFHGALYAITGVTLSIQTVVQMIAGYLNPGKPIANMYFVLYSYNTVSQAILLLRDLKIGQYTKLPPRAAFTAQIIGTLLGAVLNYFLMNSIIDNHRDVLLSVQGTNMWSGAQPQAYNSQAIAWGGLSHELFSAGMRYQWVPWSYLVGLAAPVPFWLVHRYWPKLRADYLYIPIICQMIGWLSGGITSMVISFFTIALASQWWIRTRHPRWFQKYNYLVGAALDGGTQVMVFILSFAVNGLAGKAHLFPAWWGANHDGNYDHCLNLG